MEPSLSYLSTFVVGALVVHLHREDLALRGVPGEAGRIVEAESLAISLEAKGDATSWCGFDRSS